MRIEPIYKGTYIFKKGDTFKDKDENIKQIMEDVVVEIKIGGFYWSLEEPDKSIKTTIPVLTIETGEIEDKQFKEIYWAASNNPYLEYMIERIDKLL